MQKLLFPVTCLIFSFFQVSGQSNPNEFTEAPPVLLRNEVSFGINLHSSGWGVDFRRGKNLTVSKKRMFEAEFVGIKHPKEIKSLNPYFENSKSFVYGKLNSVSVLRAAMGYQRVIAGKGEQGGVEIRFNYTGGLSIGFAKPVYLNIITQNSDRPGFIALTTEKYDPEKFSIDDIYGRAPFTKGLGETKIYPGLYLKTGLSFEYGALDRDVKIIEVGVTVDAYGKTIPIMAFSHNRQVHFNFYINILYGRKW